MTECESHTGEASRDGARLRHLTLSHPSGTTGIVAGHGALDAVAGEVRRWTRGRTVFVLSSAPVLGLHGAALDSISTEARSWRLIEVDDGEQAKRLSAAESVWQRMLLAGGKRDSRLIAFGGGSVGDLGGFAAGCFLRGIDYMQIPTTLLGQVDAALGGKTAIDLDAAKNSVGLFHHPARVVCETAFLGTLPAAELRSGLMEVVKMAMLLDEALLARVEEDIDDLLTADPDALAPVVAQAASAKIGVVERDPAEAGERRLLNFGHTLGHAIESALGYSGLRHGEAVGYGMLFALRLAERRGLDRAGGERLRRLLARIGLPRLPEDLVPADLMSRMARDKKASEAGLAWVLPSAIGAARIVSDVPGDEVESALSAFLRDPWSD